MCFFVFVRAIQKLIPINTNKTIYNYKITIISSAIFYGILLSDYTLINWIDWTFWELALRANQQQRRASMQMIRNGKCLHRNTACACASNVHTLFLTLPIYLPPSKLVFPFVVNSHFKIYMVVVCNALCTLHIATQYKWSLPILSELQNRMFSQNLFKSRVVKTIWNLRRTKCKQPTLSTNEDLHFDKWFDLFYQIICNGFSPVQFSELKEKHLTRYFWMRATMQSIKSSILACTLLTQTTCIA